mmetsp:Transcript_150483/g.382571  ORF Transcript_150483/g.382571 Transcript_150483/m.382571 type:complete len:490 (+) Transcript_150483:121-1590(+)
MGPAARSSLPRPTGVLGHELFKSISTGSGSPTFWTGEFLLIVCCAVDAADRALLPAVYGALQQDLHATPSRLGALWLLQSAAFALAMPIWGVLLVRFSQQQLLALGCFVWGVATGCLALSSQYWVHCILRAVNGVGLSAVLPISQAMLADLVPEHERGQAFGRLQACISLTGMFAACYALSQQHLRFVIFGVEVHGWRLVHGQVAIASLGLAVLIQTRLRMPAAHSSEKVAPTLPPSWGDSVHSLLEVARRFVRVPSFILLVLQGVVGAVPWQASQFASLYYSSCGYTDKQLGVLAACQGLGGASGTMLGGFLGDRAAQQAPHRGRALVALSSVVLGIVPFLTIFLVIPHDPSYVFVTAGVVFGFSLLASWSPAAAIRPICTELVSSSSERAQLMALQVMLESTTSSALGGPLVGKISEQFGYRLDKAGAAVSNESASAMASAIAGIAIVCWVLCAMMWAIMLVTLPVDRLRLRKSLSQQESSSATTYS